MSKTYKEQILDYLWSIAPKGAGNGQIRQASGIPSHQQVYLLTQELRTQGLIHGRQAGRNGCSMPMNLRRHSWLCRVRSGRARLQAARCRPLTLKRWRGG